MLAYDGDMPTASLKSFGFGSSMAHISQNVIRDASPIYHRLWGASDFTICDTPVMGDEKNGGPNYLRAWREFRKLSQAQLADAVGTNQNMIAYLEGGDRALSAKWLRRLSVALDTTPGMLLDHDPHQLDADVIDIWAHASDRQKRQLSEIAKTLLRTGTND